MLDIWAERECFSRFSVKSNCTKKCDRTFHSAIDTFDMFKFKGKGEETTGLKRSDERSSEVVKDERSER